MILHKSFEYALLVLKKHLFLLLLLFLTHLKLFTVVLLKIFDETLILFSLFFDEYTFLQILNNVYLKNIFVTV